MGECGIPRNDFLYEMKLWEIRAITKGYDRKRRDLWSATRWQTFYILSAMPYCDLSKNGITKPTDLIKFPWEEDSHDKNLPSEEEVDELVAMMQNLNSKQENEE